MDSKTESIHAGHRKRMREQYLKRGNLDGYDDHQILEMLLFYAIQRRDVNPLAHKLIDRFGSLRYVLEASVEELCEAGLSENSAVLLKLVHDVNAAVIKNESYNAEIKSVSDAIRICHGLLFSHKAETLLLLCLDVKNRIIKICTRTDKSSSSVSAVPKWIADAALSTNAYAVVIAHNHPSGSVEPSNSDVNTIKVIVDLLNTLDIKIYDNIIVTRDEGLSISKGVRLSASDMYQKEESEAGSDCAAG